MPIDKLLSRSEGEPIVQFDLSCQDQVTLLKGILKEEAAHVVHVHFSPACGTASQARKRKIPGCDNAPRPLRCEAFPDGKPDLTDAEAQRVHLANLSYFATAELAHVAIALDISISIENPANSVFWKTTPIAALVSDARGSMIVFHACMHGGDRDKLTAWWTLDPLRPHTLFEELAIKCDRQHKHAPWTPYKLQGKMVFPTAEEAVYPRLLCERVISELLAKAKCMGFIMAEDLQQQAELLTVPQHRPLFAGQPRGSKWKPLVSLFASTRIWLVPVDGSDKAASILQDLPKGSAVVHRQLCHGDIRGSFAQFFGVQRRWEEVHLPEGMNFSDTGDRFEFQEAGTPREPEDFVKEAVRQQRTPASIHP